MRDGVLFVGPNDGDMACGEFGPGRMAEPLEIAAAIEAYFSKGHGALAGVRALVTAGPTHEPLDPVRFIANRSSGKQGYAIADALARAGAETMLVSGPVEIEPPSGVKLLKVTTAREMLAACEASLPADVAVCTAAVADWRPEIAANSKIKKEKNAATPTIRLVENPDILATLAKHKQRPHLLIGFAAETENVIDHAIAKRLRKGCDWIVANDVSPHTGIMGGDKQHGPSDHRQGHRKLAGTCESRKSARVLRRASPKHWKATRHENLAACACRTRSTCRCPPMPPRARPGSICSRRSTRKSNCSPANAPLVPSGIAIELPPRLRGAGAAAFRPRAQSRRHRV